LRKRNLTAVCGALSQLNKDNDIKAAIQTSSLEELDVLMKYIYAGLSNGQWSTALFKWHTLVLEQAGGLGCIVRVITDRVNMV